MLQIGPYSLPNPVVLAPMAGVTDLPFRQLCRQLGAGMVVGEMVASNPSTRNSRKTQLRLNHDGEPEPIAVQIVGGDPEIMRSEEHTSELQSRPHLVCRLLLEK